MWDFSLFCKLLLCKGNCVTLDTVVSRAGRATMFGAVRQVSKHRFLDSIVSSFKVSFLGQKCKTLRLLVSIYATFKLTVHHWCVSIFTKRQWDLTLVLTKRHHNFEKCQHLSVSDSLTLWLMLRLATSYEKRSDSLTLRLATLYEKRHLQSVFF